jgi:endonuclease III
MPGRLRLVLGHRGQGEVDEDVQPDYTNRCDRQYFLSEALGLMMQEADSILSKRAAPVAVSLKELKNTRLYSEELGIDLKKGGDEEYFKWFLASLLFGGHISETIANKTYRAFERHELLTPGRILEAGWSFLVHPIMWEGGYVRYDGKKSMQILRDCETLVETYGGSLKALNDRSADPRDLEEKLTAFYGVGQVTTNIFLRELRPYWRFADPEPLSIVRNLARKFDIDLDALNRKTLTFARIEAGLIRMRRER